MDMPRELTETVEMLCGTIECQVFYCADFPQALLIGSDSTWIVRVYADGDYESAYTSQLPMETFLGLGENEHTITDDVTELQGFATGFDC